MNLKEGQVWRERWPGGGRDNDVKRTIFEVEEGVIYYVKSWGESASERSSVQSLSTKSFRAYDHFLETDA